MKQSTTVHETLEGKLRNSNVEISSLREQLDHLAADLSQARSTADHLQSQLSSEVAGRDQAIASLQEEVSMLRRSSVMSTISQEVQDKIDDLEEMLRQKVKEVEENDEAWIIEQKEKKKLARQVETLTRKVHNLEKKLLAAREAAENRNAVPLSSLKPIVAQAHDLPSESAHMAEVRTTSAPIPPPVSATAGVSASPTGSSQTHPDLSTVPFVQAPEHLSGMTAPMTSESTIGKKRRAPDDFDDCDTLPPQAFTVECAPRPGVTKSHTPRSRKLTAARAGFTPVRSTRTETVMMQQSPRRVTTASATTSAYSDPAQEGRIRATSLHRPHSRNLTEADYRHPVSDVTNSPRTVPATMGASATAAAKTAKKGWLNKMRTPALPSEARSTVSSRPMVFKKYNELRRTPV
ncbi:hypothetical protein PUNSTDRAFT_48774 [Punctularia strigosozonata HHB-11173 SS5]|uniref:uncharacterized protein n=1 Tax=Punctularia strigosozonata (strain HHB-11173) TaxID=741275 RepID=UPI0004416B68|nr:uncharacterized protein PUNSTDRAFT_48774 [Punctularia strigosozonata HHB-11173 SS5]EIN13876.1 hypothetical protein PUNSTDRAFT_48774 [Punctularia strigosozonata HHB-11173 SS5]